jgi:hypothetical protein
MNILSRMETAMDRDLHRGALATSALVCIALCPAPAAAQSAADIAALRAEIQALQRDTDAKVAAIQAETRARIAAIEARMGGAPAPSPAVGPAGSSGTVAATTVPSSAPAPVLASAVPAAPKRLVLSGDARLRFEQNFGGSRPERGREVVRGRFQAVYNVDKHFSFGARLVTGDPDDPNSADITLTQFDDDLQVALDKFYAKGQFGGLTLLAGKFDNPFSRTELVWDNDVNPQGVSASYLQPLGAAAGLRATAMHFIVDESAGGDDSRMDGGQVGLTVKPAPDLTAEFAGAYYHYDLPSLVGADSGDFRSNLIAGGRYLSRFHLLDVTGALGWAGLGARWPVRLVGDWVRNQGAAVPQDEGFLVELAIGRTSQKHDWRFLYNYSEAGVDAVLAAFSHDNTDLGSNYIQHTFGIDYVPMPNDLLNATLYRYRVRDALYPAAIPAGEWANRLRLHLSYAF